MAEVEESETQVLRARSAKPHQRAKSARQRSQHVNEVNKLDMSAGSLSSVDSGTESVHHEEEIHSSGDDLSPARDPNEPPKRVDQTLPWKKERPATSVSTRRQRPKSKSGSAKPKNNRPKSCHISSQYTPEHPGYVEYLRPFSAFRPPLKRVVNIPDAFSNSHLLQHPNLSEGQKTYLWHTASVYSVSNLKHLQQRRYEQMIQHQVDIVLLPVNGSTKRPKPPKSGKKRQKKHRCGHLKGLHNPKDCERYIKYLLGQRQRQFEVDPRIWRNPPRIAPRGRFYHRRDKTVDYESGEDEDIDQDAPPRRPQTAVTSSRYGRPTTSKSRPQTATSGHGRSKSRPQTATDGHGKPKSRPKPAYEKRFPSGQPSDKQLYYDTTDRQLKSPDQREKEEEVKKEKMEKKEKKKKEKEEKEKKEREEREERSKRREKSNEKESPKKTQNSENNSVEKKVSREKKAKKKERKQEQKTDEEIETQKDESSKKPIKKKESSKTASVKDSKENIKEDENNKKGITRRKSVKKDKTSKEPVAEVANDDADNRAIETVQQGNELGKKTDNVDTAADGTKPTEAEKVNDRKNTESQVKIFVGEEPHDQEDFEKEDYDDIGEFDPMFENRLQKKQQEDTISVYSSFSVDIPITSAQAPSELEY